MALRIGFRCPQFSLLSSFFSLLLGFLFLKAGLAKQGWQRRVDKGEIAKQGWQSRVGKAGLAKQCRPATAARPRGKKKTNQNKNRTQNVQIKSFFFFCAPAAAHSFNTSVVAVVAAVCGQTVLVFFLRACRGACVSGLLCVLCFHAWLGVEMQAELLHNSAVSYIYICIYILCFSLYYIFLFCFSFLCFSVNFFFS